jgi:hypothetical protein
VKVRPKPVVRAHVAPKHTAAPTPSRPLVVDRPTRKTTTLVSGGIAATSTSSSAARVLAFGGLLLALLLIAASLVPLSAVPRSVGMRLEANRLTVALTGTAIGIVLLIGILVPLASQ